MVIYELIKNRAVYHPIERAFCNWGVIFKSEKKLHEIHWGTCVQTLIIRTIKRRVPHRRSTPSVKKTIRLCFLCRYHRSQFENINLPSKAASHVILCHNTSLCASKGSLNNLRAFTGATQPACSHTCSVASAGGRWAPTWCARWTPRW